MKLYLLLLYLVSFILLTVQAVSLQDNDFANDDEHKTNILPKIVSLFTNIPDKYSPENDPVLKKPFTVCWTHEMITSVDESKNITKHKSNYLITLEEIIKPPNFVLKINSNGESTSTIRLPKKIKIISDSKYDIITAFKTCKVRVSLDEINKINTKEDEKDKIIKKLYKRLNKYIMSLPNFDANVRPDEDYKRKEIVKKLKLIINLILYLKRKDKKTEHPDMISGQFRPKYDPEIDEQEDNLDTFKFPYYEKIKDKRPNKKQKLMYPWIQGFDPETNDKIAAPSKEEEEDELEDDMDKFKFLDDEKGKKEKQKLTYPWIQDFEPETDDKIPTFSIEELEELEDDMDPFKFSFDEKTNDSRRNKKKKLMYFEPETKDKIPALSIKELKELEDDIDPFKFSSDERKNDPRQNEKKKLKYPWILDFDPETNDKIAAPSKEEQDELEDNMDKFKFLDNEKRKKEKQKLTYPWIQDFEPETDDKIPALSIEELEELEDDMDPFKFSFDEKTNDPRQNEKKKLIYPWIQNFEPETDDKIQEHPKRKPGKFRRIYVPKTGKLDYEKNKNLIKKTQSIKDKLKYLISHINQKDKIPEHPNRKPGHLRPNYVPHIDDLPYDEISKDPTEKQKPKLIFPWLQHFDPKTNKIPALSLEELEDDIDPFKFSYDEKINDPKQKEKQKLMYPWIQDFYPETNDISPEFSIEELEDTMDPFKVSYDEKTDDPRQKNIHKLKYPWIQDYDPKTNNKIPALSLEELEDDMDPFKYPYDEKTDDPRQKNIHKLKYPWIQDYDPKTNNKIPALSLEELEENLDPFKYPYDERTNDPRQKEKHKLMYPWIQDFDPKTNDKIPALSLEELDDNIDPFKFSYDENINDPRQKEKQKFIYPWIQDFDPEINNKIPALSIEELEDNMNPFKYPYDKKTNDLRQKEKHKLMNPWIEDFYPETNDKIPAFSLEELEDDLDPFKFSYDEKTKDPRQKEKPKLEYPWILDFDPETNDKIQEHPIKKPGKFRPNYVPQIDVPELDWDTLKLPYDEKINNIREKKEQSIKDKLKLMRDLISNLKQNHNRSEQPNGNPERQIDELEEMDDKNNETLNQLQLKLLKILLLIFNHSKEQQNIENISTEVPMTENNLITENNLTPSTDDKNLTSTEVSWATTTPVTEANTEDEIQSIENTIESIEQAEGINKDPLNIKQIKLLKLKLLKIKYLMSSLKQSKEPQNIENITTEIPTTENNLSTDDINLTSTEITWATTNPVTEISTEEEFQSTENTIESSKLVDDNNIETSATEISTEDELQSTENPIESTNLADDNNKETTTTKITTEDEYQSTDNSIESTILADDNNKETTTEITTEDEFQSTENSIEFTNMADDNNKGTTTEITTEDEFQSTENSIESTKLVDDNKETTTEITTEDEFQSTENSIESTKLVDDNKETTTTKITTAITTEKEFQNTENPNESTKLAHENKKEPTTTEISTSSIKTPKDLKKLKKEMNTLITKLMKYSKQRQKKTKTPISETTTEPQDGDVNFRSNHRKNAKDDIPNFTIKYVHKFPKGKIVEECYNLDIVVHEIACPPEDVPLIIKAGRTIKNIKIVKSTTLPEDFATNYIMGDPQTGKCYLYKKIDKIKCADDDDNILLISKVHKRPHDTPVDKTKSEMLANFYRMLHRVVTTLKKPQIRKAEKKMMKLEQQLTKVFNNIIANDEEDEETSIPIRKIDIYQTGDFKVECKYVNKYIQKILKSPLDSESYFNEEMLPVSAVIVQNDVPPKRGSNYIYVEGKSAVYVLNVENEMTCPQKLNNITTVVKVHKNNKNILTNSDVKNIIANANEEGILIEGTEIVAKEVLPNNITVCTIITTELLAFPTDCPEDTANLPVFKNPDLLEMICPEKMKNKIKIKFLDDFLINLGIIMYADDEMENILTTLQKFGSIPYDLDLDALG